MPSTNLSFRTPYPLLGMVSSRDPKGLKNPGGVARRDLERWYAALADSLKTVRLAPAEAVLLIRLVSEVSEPDGEFVERLSDHVVNNPADGFSHVQVRLAQKLSSFDRLTRWALVDAVERYKIYSAKNPDATMGMALHQVGLHSYDVDPAELAALESTPATQLDRVRREG